MSGESDFGLLSAWRGGDQAAGQRLLKRHFRSLYLFFSNKISGDVSDLVQQTMLGCVEGRDRIREDGSFKAFVLGVARHRLYDHFAARARGYDQPLGELPVQTLSPSPTSIIVHKQAQRRLLSALRMIPLELQVVLELHYWEALSTAELANVLGVPQGTAKSRLRRARQALEAALEQDDDISQATTADDLERWARSIREDLDIRLGASPA